MKREGLFPLIKEVVGVFKRPTILCRRSSGDRHEFVVALPEGSAPDSADRFAAAREIRSFRRLSGGRIAFQLEPGPQLTRLLKEAFSGTLGGYPVVRALMDPESFPAERGACDLGEAQRSKPSDDVPIPATGGIMSLKAIAAAGIAFLLGIAASGLIGHPGPPSVGAGESVVSAPVERAANVPVDLGTFLTAKGPAAAFRSKDGTIRYALADGSLEDRLRPGMEVRVAPDVRPALFTPVRELRDSDGSFVFHRLPTVRGAPDLGEYAPVFDPESETTLVWETAADSTRSFYALRSRWRAAGTLRVKLEGALEETEEGPCLRVGPIRVGLTEMSDVDLLNLSMSASRSAEVWVYGTVADEVPWEILRLDPRHPAFSFCVEWIEPKCPEMLCRAEGIESSTIPLPLGGIGK